MASLLTVFGGPGCGKTTALLSIVEKELANGVPANSICYTTFTRKAAHEARSRAAERFGLDPKSDLRWFSTLHSLSYRALGLSRGDVFSARHYRTVAALAGNIELAGTEDDPDTGLWNGHKAGDRAIFIEQLSRATKRPISEVCLDLGFDRWDAQHWALTLNSWKRSNHLVDFTDMLERAIETNAMPPFRVLIVDEAQDLSPLQWQLVLQMARKAERVYIGGDDDQAIYQWSGADVAQFLDVANSGEINVLRKSYRLPSNVFNTCARILRDIKVRQPKAWAPARDGGTVAVMGSFAEAGVDTSPEGGSWFLLSRNSHYAKHLKGYCFSHGIPYTSKGLSSLDRDEVRAAMAWTTLARGGVVNSEAATLCRRFMREGLLDDSRRTLHLDGDDWTMARLIAEAGFIATDRDWSEALAMDPAVLHYIRMVRQNGYKLSVTPWITISTIHQVKGGEADNVWLETNMTKKSYQGLWDDPDSEHRVFYVGSSRAKKNLYIGAQSSTYGYGGLL